jgi:hypothetical protein
VPSFSVDTKLFQELGELLVAKESTALVELIKNAYDADATEVALTGTNLSDAKSGSIVVADDGSGMTGEEFELGFLRIAGRTKLTGDRHSLVFGRRYTGEKGVGRLAAHKLATRLEILSSKAGSAARGGAQLRPPISTVRAIIDWDEIESLETLAEVADSDAIKIATLRPTPDSTSGTRIALSPLRRAWTDRMRSAFIREAATLVPHAALWQRLPEGLVRNKLLFDTVPIRDQSSADPGFRIDFRGELSIGDVILPDVAEAAHWIAEIHYDRRTGVLKLAVEPTRTALRYAPVSEGFRFSICAGGDKGPSFRARILQRSNTSWEPSIQGIRVFMEGFRVPPYGEQTDDWLDLERDYKSRTARQLISLQSIDMEGCLLVSIPRSSCSKAMLPILAGSSFTAAHRLASLC